jgi:hypothetical protein
MMDVVLLLISGASGAGKSSVREAIAADVEPAITAVELRHLGAIPNPPTLEWRQRMAEVAVLRAMELDEEGRHLLLAGDPVAPGEVLAAPSAPMVEIAVCLLDVDEEAQREAAAPRRPRGAPPPPCCIRGLASTPRSRPSAYIACAQHRRPAGDAVVSVDEHAGRPLADQCHRRLENE